MLLQKTVSISVKKEKFKSKKLIEKNYNFDSKSEKL